MRVLRFIKNEEGFTIQELMVVLIVGSLLIGFTLSLFLFTHKMLFSWQRKSEVERTVNHVLHNIALEISTAREIIEITDTTATFKNKNGNMVTYRFDGKSLYRNHDIIHSGDDIQLSIKVSNNPSSLISLNVKGRSKSFVCQAEIKTMPLISGKEAFIRTSRETE
jgi:hypothetical protein